MCLFLPFVFLFLVVGCWLWVVGFIVRQTIIPTTNNPQPTTKNQQPTTENPRPTTKPQSPSPR